MIPVTEIELFRSCTIVSDPSFEGQFWYLSRWRALALQFLYDILPSHAKCAIVIKGARQHNLKNLDLVIPRDQLMVITGLSGSGKSSLAFDTIYAEGQRRYVESLSAYARQFLDQMTKPDVDSIDGLSPAISIEQKTTSHNPRSTVGTVTEIYDYFRLLFAQDREPPFVMNVGMPLRLKPFNKWWMQLWTFGQAARSKFLAPIVRGRKGEYRKELLAARKAGFVRVRIDGVIRDLGEIADPP